jgi:hypothetical protein
MNTLPLKEIRSNGFKLTTARLARLFVILLVILTAGVSTYAQSSPPSRPILFVHGWCGSVYDWTPLPGTGRLSRRMDAVELTRDSGTDCESSRSRLEL